jgi:hypothetical protein
MCLPGICFVSRLFALMNSLYDCGQDREIRRRTVKDIIVIWTPCKAVHCFSSLCKRRSHLDVLRPYLSFIYLNFTLIAPSSPEVANAAPS